MPAETEYTCQDHTTDSPERLKIMAARAYADQRHPPISERQITEYIPMVHSIVQRVVTYLRPPLTFEDLVSAGTIGLLKAVKDYDASQKAEFKTYAYIRIRGAVLDELKGWSFVSADLNKRIANIAKIRRQISEQTGKEPSDNEIAAKLGISVEKVYQAYEDARAQNFVSIDDGTEEAPSLQNIIAAVKAEAPDENLQKSELTETLTQAIEELPRRQRQLIVLYYTKNLTMKQIAEVFEITESRVSQIHASALFSLSVKLKEWKNG